MTFLKAARLVERDGEWACVDRTFNSRTEAEDIFCAASQAEHFHEDETSNHITFPKSLLDCHIYTSHLLHICHAPHPIEAPCRSPGSRVWTSAFAASVTPSYTINARKPRSVFLQLLPPAGPQGEARRRPRGTPRSP